jgi:hypothetical protein
VGHPYRVPVLLLTGVGLLLLVVSAGGVYAGLALARQIYALLPSIITADAAAIGGAAMALGLGALLLGLAHLAMAFVLARARGAAGEATLVSAIALCAVMAALAVGWSVTALVSAAAGTAPADSMLPAGIGLAVLAALYGWATLILVRSRRDRRGPI